MEETFELDELVWAKLSGYPWWPCKILAHSNKQMYEICFLVEFTTCILAKDKLRKLDLKNLSCKR